MVARVLLGRRPLDGSLGMDISKSGFDALTNDPLVNPERFNFSSKWQRLDELIMVGTGVASGSAPGQVYFDLDVTSVGYWPYVSYRLSNIYTDALYHDESWHKYPNTNYSNLITVSGYSVGSSRIIRFATNSNGTNYTPTGLSFNVHYMVWGINVGAF